MTPRLASPRIVNKLWILGDVMKCDRCNKAATIHLTEKNKVGEVSALHLCEHCAIEAGYMQKSHISVTDMLATLIEGQSQTAQGEAVQCPNCAMTWKEFKDTGLLGCPGDYDIFSRQLMGVIESAQQGATHHTGKTPRPIAPNSEAAIKLRQSRLNKLRQKLTRAVEKESYEEAAIIRDAFDFGAG